MQSIKAEPWAPDIVRREVWTEFCGLDIISEPHDDLTASIVSLRTNDLRLGKFYGRSRYRTNANTFHAIQIHFSALSSRFDTFHTLQCPPFESPPGFINSKSFLNFHILWPIEDNTTLISTRQQRLPIQKQPAQVFVGIDEELPPEIPCISIVNLQYYVLIVGCQTKTHFPWSVETSETIQ